MSEITDSKKLFDKVLAVVIAVAYCFMAAAGYILLMHWFPARP